MNVFCTLKVRSKSLAREFIFHFYLNYFPSDPVVVHFFKRIPLESAFQRPKCHIRQNRVLNDFWVFVSHMIPAYLTDMMLLIMGQKPQMVNIYSKLHKTIATLDFFTHNQWTWTHKNTDLLVEAMTPDDREVSCGCFC